MILGITGNIGAGKTTFSKFLKFYGFKIINADEIGKKLLQKGEAGYEPVVEAFGKEILDKIGEIDKRKLAGIVFSDHHKLKLLNSIIHPLIGESIRNIKDNKLPVFIEAALLVEAGWHKNVDAVITVFAYKGQRILRAAKRFGIKEVLKRERFQLPYKEKLKHTDFLICNTSSLLKLKEETEVFIKTLDKLL
ncbi:dephospho-CoA kinase [Desulfurobacterium atlanticum]|uniref:Dephospho-CoA kinase n=1 Tax=Desulfurobacterium atlanticum TaxID=240169 RepID=A0A238XQ24_9BACT|nr:dephospho-CoA kinase [Desulfurobacterium atlanticum]SNR61116.1 dephospho-CoA kinase [Desulfurobacterium atlanticum]